MTRQVFFIAGTDTGVGKTHITVQLLQQARESGLQTLGLKPIAAGADWCDGELQNEDALLLQKHSTLQLPYETINPWCLAEPIAPHIAAANSGIRLSAENIAAELRDTIDNCPADYLFIEGAGGWRLPLNAQETLADVVKLLEIPVLLVVGMKLGCLNHALLTAEAIRADGLTLAGWFANDLGNPMPALAENIRTLEQWLGLPAL